MAESFFDLSKEDQREALEYAPAQSGRPAHLPEKDIWVVWALRALFDSPIANDLTFKGGTSLSKVYKIIDRFSEDINLTYDIRKLIPDLLGEDGELPTSRSQANKWTKAVRNRLPDWITNEVLPVIQQALKRNHLEAQIGLSDQDNDKLLLRYPALMQGTDYVAPVVTLEFGGRDVAIAVARHKSYFFIEKDAVGQIIDYAAATAGNLTIVPTGEAKVDLEQDYGAMLPEEIIIGNSVPSDELLKACAEVESIANHYVADGINHKQQSDSQIKG
ncbi:MAG: nucleotidyl transferase AbiEii/AbiGii toxin family protein [Desulfobacterium sp.]|nr:nucleotidyl transferase AbiEii/AbiGii toxin family protein [Desulfobacterium sp.]